MQFKFMSPKYNLSNNTVLHFTRLTTYSTPIILGISRIFTLTVHQAKFMNHLGRGHKVWGKDNLGDWGVLYIFSSGYLRKVGRYCICDQMEEGGQCSNHRSGDISFHNFRGNQFCYLHMRYIKHVVKDYGAWSLLLFTNY